VATLSTESLLIDYVSKFVPPLFVFLRSLTIGAPSCMPIYLFIFHVLRVRSGPALTAAIE
jgi:hypothetical protein